MKRQPTSTGDIANSVPTTTQPATLSRSLSYTDVKTTSETRTSAGISVEDDEYGSDSDAEADPDKPLPLALQPDDTMSKPVITVDVVDPTKATQQENRMNFMGTETPALLPSFKKGEVPLIAMQDDVYRVRNQNYACVSVIKPSEYAALHHGERKYHGLLFKIRGVFATRAEADQWIRSKIMNLDPHFDVHLIKCHSWSGLEDDDVNDREYLDDEINEIMSGYFAEEHDKQLGLNTRVQIAKAKDKRTKESGNFYRHANSETGEVPGKLPQHPSSLPDIPKDAKAVTLDIIRRNMAENEGRNKLLTEQLGGYLEKDNSAENDALDTNFEQNFANAVTGDHTGNQNNHPKSTIMSTVLDKENDY